MNSWANLIKNFMPISLYKKGSNLEILLKLGLLVGVGLVRVFGVGAGTIFGAVAPEPATGDVGPVLVNL